MTLVEFLRARIDEDEETAVKAGGGSWTYNGHIWLIVDDDGEPVVYEEGSPNWFQSSHIVRHDPARVLREVAAKRAIVEGGHDDQHECSDWQQSSAYPYVGCNVLRRMAAIYSDHPDYDSSWS